MCLFLCSGTGINCKLYTSAGICLELFRLGEIDLVES